MRTRSFVLVLAMAVAAMTGLAARRERAPAVTAWDAAAAARYLDARMDVWWAKAKTLKTGTGETKCLSCHTALPYALARPALRIAMGVAEPTAHETRILDTVRQRVEHLGDEAPFYDHTEAKKAESRGVEAVINALVLTRNDTLGRAARPSELTAKAMARLWDVQRPDGAWDWLDFGLEPYETTDAVFHGATLAAMAAGAVGGGRGPTDDAGKAGVERLRGYLTANLSSQRLFNRTWALLASSSLPGVMTAAQREAAIRELEAKQRPDGGWSLADLGEWRWSKGAGPFASPGTTDAALLGASDGYATGLVLYAMKLDAHARSGAAFAKGQAWLRAHQQPARDGDASWAPWRAYSLNFDREHGGEKGEPWRRLFMSDLATAFAVLALQ